MSYINIPTKGISDPLTVEEFNYLIERLNSRQLNNLVDIQQSDAQDKDIIRHNGSGWVYYNIQNDHYTKAEINQLFGVGDIGEIPSLTVDWGNIQGVIRDQQDLVDNFGDLKSDANIWDGKHYAENYILDGSAASVATDGYMDYFYLTDGDNSIEVSDKSTIGIKGDGVTLDFVNKVFNINTVSTFFELTDTPNLGIGFENHFVKVSASGTEIDFFDIDKNYLDAFGLDADTLDGLDSTDFYLATNPDNFVDDSYVSNELLDYELKANLGSNAYSNDVYYLASNPNNYAPDQDLSGLAQLNHNHNDLYYTESEIDLLLVHNHDLQYSGINHTHDIGDITDIMSILNINDWDTAFGWGNHSSQGYLTEYIETDPIFNAWDKSSGISITESQISDLGSYLTLSSLDNYLAKDNSIEYIPTNDYNPSTKKYVDESVSVITEETVIDGDFNCIYRFDGISDIDLGDRIINTNLGNRF